MQKRLLTLLRVASLVTSLLEVEDSTISGVQKLSLNLKVSSVERQRAMDERSNLSCDPIRICQICYFHADKGQKHYFHYGAICCFSCKAFFRRIHRENLLHTLTCVNGDEKCDLRFSERTNCKKCRYLSCLKAGLDPEKILNEKDRKKFTHGKKKKKGKSIGTEAGKYNKLQNS